MAATTATRSTRRVDGLHHPHHHPHIYNSIYHQPSSQQSHSHLVTSGNTGPRKQAANMAAKRHLPPLERDIETIKRRKPNFVVEIPSKPASHHIRNHNSHHDNKQQQQPTQQTVASSQPVARPPEPAPQRPHVAKTANANPVNRPTNAAGTAGTGTATAVAPPQRTPATTTVTNTNKTTSLPKHKEKVANGLKHELNRLQPSEAVIKEQGRKLRSQEATRFKSELSAYFPDYDEVIGNDPKEHHLLNIETPILIRDSRVPLPSNIPLTTAAQGSTSGPNILPPRSLDSLPVHSYGDNLFTDLCDSQRIDLSFLKAQQKGKSNGDSLADPVFEGSHKKAERLERSIRNLERGRAQHEKDQVIRLLDGLQGPDWLKIMGVSGITEGKKKSYEPARAHFIKGCQAILNKFRWWSAEEKRRKQEKDRKERGAKALRDTQERDAEEEEEEEDEDEEEEAEAEDEVASEVDDDQEEEDLEEADDGAAEESEGDPPDSIDVQHSIAKQLREEALAAAKTNARSRARARGENKHRKRRSSASAQPQPAAEPEPPLREFRSFFSKPYQRAAAVGKNRRKGRTVLAWGHPVPDVPARAFELPEELLDEEMLRVQARRKRKERRGKH